MPWRGLLDLIDQCDRLATEIDRHFLDTEKRSMREQRHRVHSLRLTIHEVRRRIERADHVTPAEVIPAKPDDPT